MTVHRVYADFEDGKEARRFVLEMAVRGQGGWHINPMQRDVAGVECTWTEDEDGNHTTECGHMVCGLTEVGTAKENGYNFCHCCGRPMVEKSYQEENDGDDLSTANSAT